MLALATASFAFAPTCNVGVSRPAVHNAAAPTMSVEDIASRRQLFARAGAALLGGAMAQSASAKAGQFGKIGIFGMEDISSPYQPGGPKSGPEATFGYQKSAGEFLAKGYESDTQREKRIFQASADKIKSLGPSVEKKVWWLVRDELRVQASEMRSSMLVLNKNSNSDGVDKAYKVFWKEIESLDLACKKKEPALASKEFQDVLAALDAYAKLV